MIGNFALIIGAMRCGTTSLFTYLAQHPEVAPSTPKEPDFFANDGNWGKGFEWYQTLWDWDPHKHTIALEASTNYTKIPGLPNAAERIATIKADFRFIYVLRDPIERIESQYAHAVMHGKAAIPEGGEGELRTHWIAVSKYAMQIAEYYGRFPSDRILLLNFDDLKKEPDAVVKRVCRFVDIDPSSSLAGVGTVHNPSKRDHPLYVALTRSSLACSVAKLLPLGFKQGLRNRLGRRKLNVDIRLSEAQRAFVLHELEEDMKRLHEEYGFDVSRWCRPQAGAEDPQGTRTR